jgi:hypothetical protein
MFDTDYTMTSLGLGIEFQLFKFKVFKIFKYCLLQGLSIMVNILQAKVDTDMHENQHAVHIGVQYLTWNN